jgi:putative addiction module component (TIGR02574 family)
MKPTSKSMSRAVNDLRILGSFEVGFKVQPRAIAAEALSLPVAERAALVLRLAESLDEQHDADAEDLWAAEVASRVEALRQGTAGTITTPEALAEARARLSARRG